MKDMTVEELISSIKNSYYDWSLTGFDSYALSLEQFETELLRRFEALEKENRRLRYVINGVTIKTPRANDPSNLDTY